MADFPDPNFFIGLGSSAVAFFLGGWATWKMLSKKLSKLFEREKECITDADIGNPDFAKHRIIHENITILRAETDADRVQVGQFHNGGKFLDGSPMKKFSISHESCGAGISFEYQNLQSVQANIFPDLIELIKLDSPVIYLTSGLPDQSSVKTYNRSKGIEALAVFPIKKQGGLIVGFVKVEWNSLSSLPEYENDFSLSFGDYRSFIQLELNRKG